MNLLIRFRNQPYFIRWNIHYFDRGSDRYAGSLRLDTLPAPEAYAAFQYDGDDPYTFLESVELGHRQVKFLQRYTDHPFDVERYTYEFGIVSESAPAAANSPDLPEWELLPAPARLEAFPDATPVRSAPRITGVRRSSAGESGQHVKKRR